MKNQTILTKFLALEGLLLVWLPLLLPIGRAALGWMQGGAFRFDFLLPGEPFYIVLPGAGLLYWAAARAQFLRQPIGWGIVLALFALLGSQVLAMVTGLDAGVTQISTLAWVLVVASVVLYWLALLACGVGGVLLLLRLFRG